jgi:hypothetical protein
VSLSIGADAGAGGDREFSYGERRSTLVLNLFDAFSAMISIRAN